MKVTVIPIVIGSLGTILKGSMKRLEDLEIRRQVETIQTIALQRSATILRRIQETWRNLLSNSNEKLSANSDVKNSQWSKIIIFKQIYLTYRWDPNSYSHSW